MITKLLVYYLTSLTIFTVTITGRMCTERTGPDERNHGKQGNAATVFAAFPPPACFGQPTGTHGCGRKNRRTGGVRAICCHATGGSGL